MEYTVGYNKFSIYLFNNYPMTPTGSIILLHSFAFLSKTLYLQRFLFYSLVFLGIPFYKRDTTKDTTFRRILKNLYILKNVPRYRLSLEWLYEYIRSLLFLNQNVRAGIGLVLKSFQLQSKDLREYV